MSLPAASASNAPPGAWGVVPVTRAIPWRSPRSPPGVGRASRRAHGEHEIGDGGRGVRAGEVAGGGGHHGVARGIGEQARHLDEPVGVEVLVLDQDRGPGRGVDLRVAPLVAGGVRVRDDRHRERERRGLREGRGAGAAHGEVGGGERRGHLVVEERVRPVSVAQLRGQRLARGERGGVPGVAGDVHDPHPLHEARQGGDHGVVDPPDGLRAAEHEQDPLAGPAAERRPCLIGVHARDRADRRAGHVGALAARAPSPSPRS